MSHMPVAFGEKFGSKKYCVIPFILSEKGKKNLVFREVCLGSKTIKYGSI